MSLHAIVLIFSILVSNLAFANCISDRIKQTKLPKKMPENTVMKWSENGGMAPYWKKIEISGNTISVEVKEIRDKKPTKWSTEISQEEKAKIYQVFEENKFDTIRNDKADGITYDAGSEGVYLRAGKISKNTSHGDNFPLSGLNKKRYFAVANAIKRFAKTIRETGTPKEIQSSTNMKFYVDKDAHSLKFNKEATAASVIKIITKAIEDHNLKQNSIAEKITISEYKFQLIPRDANNAVKEVFVNAYCRDFDPNWRDEIVSVDDGGKCFFQLNANLSDDTYNQFYVNGNG